MAEFKLVISNPKNGKSYQRELKEDLAKPMIGKKIGEEFKGEAIDLPGYEFKVTGGSDSSGFPMRWDVQGTQKKQIVSVKGIGVKNRLKKPNPKKKGWRTINGMKQKKTVAGNTIYEKTAQINIKVLKVGKENLGGEEEAPAAEAPKEEPKEEAPAKEEAKPEVVEENKKDEETVKEADKEIAEVEAELKKEE